MIVFSDGDPGPEIRRKLNEMVGTWEAALENAFGPQGWSPVLSVATDGTRRVFQVVDWVGGEGTKPTLLGYIGSTGIVADIAQAVDVRGASGPANTLAIGTVTSGASPSATITGTAPNQTLNLVLQKGDTGNTGWSPVFAVVNDGTRRVQQVVNWTGGQGTKPTTGQYVGATGLVASIASAVDIRGPAGTGNVGSNGTIVDGSIAVFEGTTGSTIKSFDAEQLPASTAVKALLDAKAPLTGTGTSGTWPISVTGNAATASAVTWANVTSKPAVIAAGATAADARTAIGAGTSNLALGTTAGTALAGDTAIQAPLVSGTNLKNVNGNSLLGSGGITVGDVTLTGTQTLTNKTLTSPTLNTPTVNVVKFASQYSAGNSGASITLNFSNGQKQSLTLNSNTTITLSFPGVGNYQIILTQDGTGNKTVTWSGVSRYVGSATAPVINTASNSSTVVSLFYDGTNTWLAASKVNA